MPKDYKLETKCLYKDIVYLYIYQNDILKLHGSICEQTYHYLISGRTRTNYIFIPDDPNYTIRNVLKVDLLYFPRMRGLWCFNEQKYIDRGYQILFYRKNRAVMNSDMLELSERINSRIEKGENGKTEIEVFQTPFEKDYAAFSKMEIGVFFKYEDNAYIKIDNSKAFNLNTSSIVEFDSETEVLKSAGAAVFMIV